MKDIEKIRKYETTIKEKVLSKKLKVVKKHLKFILIV